MNLTEVTVIIKDSDKTLRKKYPIYDDYQVRPDDPVIKNCIEETLMNFDGEPESISVKIHLDVE